MSDYCILGLILLFAAVIAVILTLVSYNLNDAVQFFDFEKISTYECGFDPFEVYRFEFNVKFYLVSILFLIFDIEIAYIFPFALGFFELDLYDFFVFFVFLFILLIGFIYEWIYGALTWE